MLSGMAFMALKPVGCLRCVAMRTPLAVVRPAASACRPAALQSSFLGTSSLGGLCSSLRGAHARRQHRAAPLDRFLSVQAATGVQRRAFAACLALSRRVALLLHRALVGDVAQARWSGFCALTWQG